jgi:Protein of unknown function (DUF1402)
VLKKSLFASAILLALVAAYFVVTRRSNLTATSATVRDKTSIDSTAVQDIKKNYAFITKAAQKYSLPVESIVGVIIAERSLHDGPVNRFEEYYVERFFLDKSDDYLNQLAAATKRKIATKRLDGESEQDYSFRLKYGLIWTIGLCQVSIINGIALDSAIAVSENRPRKTVKQTIECLLSPDGNISYAAFYLKQIRDEFWQETGYDLNTNVGALCTLYNTGRVTESISRFKRTKTPPKPNAFGAYAAEKASQIVKMLN